MIRRESESTPCSPRRKNTLTRILSTRQCASRTPSSKSSSASSPKAKSQSASLSFFELRSRPGGGRMHASFLCSSVWLIDRRCVCFSHATGKTTTSGRKRTWSASRNSKLSSRRTTSRSRCASRSPSLSLPPTDRPTHPLIMTISNILSYALDSRCADGQDRVHGRRQQL